jgi:predicted transcriptional regulator of viral defense system
MRYKELRARLERTVFTSDEVGKLFLDESSNQVNIQLARMTKRGDLVRLRRGVYALADQDLDELVVAEYLYQPAYISLETALNIYGIIPDVPGEISLVTPITVRKFKNRWGRFSYSKIDKSLFFGFEKVLDESSQLYYSLAMPEKAVLDYIYIRQIKSLNGNRVDLSEVKLERLFEFAEEFPMWVRKVLR